jgi:hypothetical protein
LPWSCGRLVRVICLGLLSRRHRDRRVHLLPAPPHAPLRRFLLSLAFVYPFFNIIPSSATVPALFMVGVYSLPAVRHIEWEDFPTAFACFLGERAGAWMECE